MIGKIIAKIKREIASGTSHHLGASFTRLTYDAYWILLQLARRWFVFPTTTPSCGTISTTKTPNSAQRTPFSSFVRCDCRLNVALLLLYLENRMLRKWEYCRDNLFVLRVLREMHLKHLRSVPGD